MDSSEEPPKIPLKRSFDCMSSKPPEAMDIDKDQSFSPDKIIEAAMQRNTIAVLKNGEEKANLALMVINEFGRSLDDSCEKKLIIFLAPTVALVQQQCMVIKCQTKLRVEEIFGAKGVDAWGRETWEQQINEHDVLVMTPQIMWDALKKALLTLDIMCLMILDECHYATGHHPYTKIMKDFYHDKSGAKPKVFGMTASPVIWKGVTSFKDCKKQISDLEVVLDSRFFTAKNKVQLQESAVSAKMAKEILRFYEPPVPLTLKLKEKLDMSLSKFDAAFVDLQSSHLYEYRDTDGRFKVLLERLSNDHANIVCCLENLGLIGAYEAVKVCQENFPDVREGCEVLQKGSSLFTCYLEGVLSIIQESLPQNREMLLAFDYSSPEAISLGYVSSKLFELIGVLRNLGKESKIKSLILVERIITAKVIEKIIKRITYLSHFTVSTLTESNQAVDILAPMLQVNLLAATDVVEKGIDVSRFSSVVYFDLPKKFDSYVLSCEARQCGSQYVVMLEGSYKIEHVHFRENLKQRDHLLNFKRPESPVENTATSRGTSCSKVKDYPTNVTATDASLNGDTGSYCVEATGASVSTKTSVTLIQRYCDKLPRDKSFIQKPEYQILLEGHFYRCQLTLPRNAAFQTLIGPAARNSLLSKQIACLEACKKLHQAGSLNDYLLPFGEDSSRKSSCPNPKAVAAGAGTTKRKELHGTAAIQALSGTWGGNIEGLSFHAYKVDFTCNDKDHHYSSFVLLLESELDKDVGNIQLDLYLRLKYVKSSVSACGQRYLNGKEVAKAKCFQEFFFNGLFGKLFVKASGERKFLFETQEASWDPSKMYLLLPLKPLMNCAQPWEINWAGIESSVSVVEFLKRHAWLNSEISENRRKNLLVNQTHPVDGESAKTIHLANKSLHSNDLKDMVVISIHTGRIYSIMGEVENSSAESPFVGKSDLKSQKYKSFADYFSKKYKIVLVHPAQPLLQLKQSHKAHNLLVDFRNEHGGMTRGNGSLKDSEKPDQKRSYAYMPPELLIIVDVPVDILKSFYLLPSIMYRLESLMLASQLRKNVVSCSDNLHISSSLILEALTTLNCNETFSMERLELLGDSVLKYAVSCVLFLKYPGEREGQLSSQRSKIICNSALHKLGTDCNLQGYIRDGAFEQNRWTAPGQLPMQPRICQHGVDSVEVPLSVNFTTENTSVIVGKSCDRGHRWMGSKTIADCVEALIGAYYVGGGLVAALHLMRWMGIDAITEPALVHDAINAASLHDYSPKMKDIECLEVKVGYEFKVKGLLLEAITYAAEQDQNASLSYQRLEFLGDAVLDILVTKHLYYNHSEIDPGELTDLRAASVNNDNFALAAVKRLLHPHLQCCSSYTNDHISTYVKSVFDSCRSAAPAPKVLGDMVESIAGAILIDTRLNLDEVWRIFEPLLSPIVTPDKLELAPLRELNEMCDSLGYHVKTNYGTRGDDVEAELRVQLEYVTLIGNGFGKSRKTARSQAALCLLKKLEERGISKPKKSKEGNGDVCNPSIKSSGCKWHIGVNAESTDMEHNEREKKRIKLEVGSDGGPFLSTVDPKDVPVIPSIEMKKGGPRSALFALCKKLQWPMPTFECSEQKSRTPFVFRDGSEERTSFNSFESKIKLIIPNSGTVEATGEARSDKKASYDSAALTMLIELHKQLKIVISGQ